MMRKDLILDIKCRWGIRSKSLVISREITAKVISRFSGLVRGLNMLKWQIQRTIGSLQLVLSGVNEVEGWGSSRKVLCRHFHNAEDNRCLVNGTIIWKIRKGSFIMQKIIGECFPLIRIKQSSLNWKFGWAITRLMLVLSTTKNGRCGDTIRALVSFWLEAS